MEAEGLCWKAFCGGSVLAAGVCSFCRVLLLEVAARRGSEVSAARCFLEEMADTTTQRRTLPTGVRCQCPMGGCLTSRSPAQSGRLYIYIYIYVCVVRVFPLLLSSSVGLYHFVEGASESFCWQSMLRPRVGVLFVSSHRIRR